MLRAVVRRAPRLRLRAGDPRARLLRWRSEISKCAPPRLLEEVHRLLRGGASRRSFELSGRDRRARRAVAAGSRGLARRLWRADHRAAGRECKPPRGRRSRGSSTTKEDPAEHDPDDPDEEPGSLPVHRRARSRGAAAEPEVELDQEEREWHRVWADDPPSRPAQAAPVKLSFLGGGELFRQAPRARVGRPPSARCRRRRRSRSFECGRVRRARRAVRPLCERR